MNVSADGILAAQSFIDDLQAAACKYQSESSAEAKLLLHTIMQELAMLKMLVTQVSHRICLHSLSCAVCCDYHSCELCAGLAETFQ